MMTSMFHSASGHYFHEPQRMYSNDLNLKQEPFDGTAETDMPVDMTLARGQCHDVRSVSDLMDGERSSYFNPYLLGLSSQHQQNSSNTDRQDEKCPKSVKLTTPHSPDEYHLKGDQGKLSMPNATEKSSRSSVFRKIELLTSSLHQRAKREFVPDEKKDEGYWSKRLKNNDSARRSRVKRKALEKMMETRLLELQKENIELKHEMAALRRRFGVEESPDCKQPSGQFHSVPDSRSYQSSSSLEDIFDKDDDLEFQSTGSEDSRSNDDSRVYSLGSVTTLNQSLGLSGRFGVNAAASRKLSSNGSCTSRSDSRSSHASAMDTNARLDRTGALDLTSESGSRSSPTRDTSSPECYSSGDKNCTWLLQEGSSGKDVPKDVKSEFACPSHFSTNQPLSVHHNSHQISLCLSITFLTKSASVCPSHFSPNQPLFVHHNSHQISLCLSITILTKSASVCPSRFSPNQPLFAHHSSHQISLCLSILVLTKSAPVCPSQFSPNQPLSVHHISQQMSLCLSITILTKSTSVCPSQFSPNQPLFVHHNSHQISLCLSITVLTKSASICPSQFSPNQPLSVHHNFHQISLCLSITILTKSASVCPSQFSPNQPLSVHHNSHQISLCLSITILTKSASVCPSQFSPNQPLSVHHNSHQISLCLSITILTKSASVCPSQFSPNQPL
ncbi:hypothetical protein Btru_045657, partial [Bulinus truncatus]